MKKATALLILSLLSLANISFAFASTNPQAVTENVVFKESAVPTLYKETLPVPVLYDEKTPLLIAEKPKSRWTYKGKSGLLKNSPIIKSKSAYYPLREIAEAMGFSVEWNDSNRSIYMTNDNFMSSMSIDNTDYAVNESYGKLDSHPIIIKGRTYLSETDIEKMIGLFISAQENKLFFNSSDVELLYKSENAIDDWLNKYKATTGTYINTNDEISYVLIVEEEKNTGGYTFDFSNIETDGEILKLDYSLKQATGMVTQAFTKPYVLLKVSSKIREVTTNPYKFSGTISDLKFDEHGASIYLDGGNPEERIDDLVVRAGMDVIIENGTFNDFKIGTVLGIDYSASSKSIPAQTNAEKIKVIETPENFSTYTGRVKDLSENETTYSIHLSKDENYMNDLIVEIQKGSYMESQIYELDGKSVTVEYTIVTMSLPPKTSPIKIKVER